MVSVSSCLQKVTTVSLNSYQTKNVLHTTNTTWLVLLQNLWTVTKHLPCYSFTYKQAICCKINKCAYSIGGNNCRIFLKLWVPFCILWLLLYFCWLLHEYLLPPIIFLLCIVLPHSSNNWIFIEVCCILEMWLEFHILICTVLFNYHKLNCFGSLLWPL